MERKNGFPSVEDRLPAGTQTGPGCVVAVAPEQTEISSRVYTNVYYSASA